MAGWISVIEILLCIGAALYLYSQLSPFRRRRVVVAVPVVLVWSLAALTVFLIPHDIQTVRRRKRRERGRGRECDVTDGSCICVPFCEF